jgi:hypothetical protein
LYYPYPRGYTLGHTLVNDGSITVDGLLEEPTGPDFSTFWMPSSPHPDGYTYGWLHSDGEYLYAAAEVTADNTPDEEDWGAIYVMVNGELEEFRVSGNAIKWGALGFQYTSSVPYEHRIYEFAIPLSEINASIGDELQYGFGSYGTVSGWQVLIQTVPINTGYIDFDGAHKVHGDVVWMEDINYPIVAHPGPGYVFSEWQVEGEVLVDELSEATTFAWAEGGSDTGCVLTMVQTSPASAVPTLSQWGIIGMAIVLAAALVWSVRKRWVNSASKS